jgi:serine/threonine protein kinase
MNKEAILKSNIYRYLLQNEMSILGSCSHPKILTTYELLEDKHNYYVVSEILKGGPVMNRLQELGHFREKDALRIVK